jgi:hypothetical protein
MASFFRLDYRRYQLIATTAIDPLHFALQATTRQQPPKQQQPLHLLAATNNYKKEHHHSASRLHLE